MDIVIFRGPKRSGNHLLIKWILEHYTHPLLLNNIDECIPTFSHANVVDLLKSCAAAKRHQHDVVLISLERPESVDCEHLQNFQRIACGLGSAPCRLPFLLRDPLNWIASYLRKDGPVSEARFAQTHLSLWASWIVNFRNWSVSPDRIDFNQFVGSPAYRESVTRMMGFCPNCVLDDRILDCLWHPNIEQPSSFDSAAVRAHAIRANQMQVTARFHCILSYVAKFGVPGFVLDACQAHWPSVLSDFQNSLKQAATALELPMAISEHVQQ